MSGRHQQMNLSVIAPEFKLLNFLEAGLWVLLGLIALAQSRRYEGVVRRDLLILAAALVAFGASDLVETRTGAWWRPWWLLLWKGACVLAMLVLLIRYARRRWA